MGWGATKTLGHFIPRPPATDTAITNEIEHADRIRGETLSTPAPARPEKSPTALENSTPFLELLHSLWYVACSRYLELGSGMLICIIVCRYGFEPLPNNRVSGKQVRDVVMQSGVPAVTLGQLWNVVDPEKQGSVDFTRFGYLIGLIGQVQRGEEPEHSLVTSSDPPPLLAPPVENNAPKAAPRRSLSTKQPKPRPRSVAVPTLPESNSVAVNSGKRGVHEQAPDAVQGSGESSVKNTAESEDVYDSQRLPMSNDLLQQSTPSRLNPLGTVSAPTSATYENTKPSALRGSESVPIKSITKPITSVYVTQSAPIQRAWWAGRVEKSKCDQVISNGNQGDFLVRESTSNPGNMVLVVHDSGQVMNFPIERQGASVALGMVVVDTLDMLIESLHKIPLTSPLTNTPLKLGHPVQLDDPTNTVQYERVVNPNDQRYVELKPNARDLKDRPHSILGSPSNREDRAKGGGFLGAVEK